MTDRRRPATLSLDLDNQWAYMRVHGDPGWEAFPSFLDRAVPRLLDVLNKHRLTITVFVVGQDAALDRNRDVLAGLRSAGHDIANHTFHHLTCFSRGTEGEIEREVAMAEQAIERATGVRPVGFRGPGFGMSPALLRVLIRRGYRYDASMFPTLIGPLARMYYRATVRNHGSGAEERATLYGTWSDGFRSIRPYRWSLAEGNLLEIPVTTMPILRTPFHLTYLLFLAMRSRGLALGYLRSALHACRATGTPPSMLLHPLDVLGADEVPELAFFPGMQLSGLEKTAFLDRVLETLTSGFSPTSIERFIEAGDVPATAAVAFPLGI